MTTSTTNKGTGQAETIKDFFEKYFKPTLQEIEGTERQPSAQILILPDGKGGLRAESIKKFSDEYKTAPDTRQGTAIMLTLDSFIDHVNRFKDAESIVFAQNSRDKPRLQAIIDYHQSTFDGAPRYCDHQVSYDFPMADEWNAWLEKDNQPMTQIEFAEFLEDRIGDVEVPPTKENLESDENEGTTRLKTLLERIGGNLAGPGTLMELSKGLKVNVEEKVHQHHTLANGETQLHFSHEHTDENGAPIKVPNMFLINIPVFNSGDVFRIPVRLRYRVRSGNITWTYQLYRTDQTFTAAFEDAVKKVEDATSLPTHIGFPEANGATAQ
jgi:uncharacterized protein YfdQ (DUF2303 family)